MLGSMLGRENSQPRFSMSRSACLNCCFTSCRITQYDTFVVHAYIPKPTSLEQEEAATRLGSLKYLMLVYQIVNERTNKLFVHSDADRTFMTLVLS